MQSSRDSSIWRSLAVAFGDGVAFGVGVKLAQGSQRPAAGAAPSVLPPRDLHSGRLEQIEQRLSSIEHAPAPKPAPQAPAPFDQKVLEAVVNALDARLKEQAGQVERRLTELEAKLAIDLKTLERQDQSIVTGLQKNLADVHGQYNEHVNAVRDAVAQDMDILYAQVTEIREALAGVSADILEPKIAAAVTAQLEKRLQQQLAQQLAQRLTQELAQRMEAVEARLTGRISTDIETMEARLGGQLSETVERSSTQAASAVSAHLDEQLASIHASLAQKDREIDELRHRVMDADQTVLDLILAMGQMCRQVADRMAIPAAPAEAPRPAAKPPEAPPPAASGTDAPVAESAPLEATEEQAPETQAEVESAPESEAAPAPAAESLAMVPTPEASGNGNGNGNGHSHIHPMPVAEAESSVPEFASVQRPSRLWKIPLVSSFILLAAGSLWLLK